VASVRRRELGDGTYRYDVTYRDPDGKQRMKTFRLKRSAAAFGIQMESDKQRGAWIDPDAGRVTFEQYAREWIEMQTFDLSTRLAVETRLGVHVYPVIGGKQLRNVKPSTMQAWLRSVEDLAPRTRLLILGHVSNIFNAAVDDLLVARNPCGAKSVRRPKVPARKVVPWEHAQVLAVREALPERYRVVVMLGAGLGLRQGECFGLSPDDIDWLRGTVQVRRQVKLIGTRQVFGPPKYGKEREVPLPESVKEWLAAYLVKWPARPITLPWRPGQEVDRQPDGDDPGADRNRAELLQRPDLEARAAQGRGAGEPGQRHPRLAALLRQRVARWRREHPGRVGVPGPRRPGVHAAGLHPLDAVERGADAQGHRRRVRA
jgi:integrase